MSKAILYGVGVGPGDPELLTAKAIRVIAESDIIAVPQSGAGEQTALAIAAQYIGDKPVLHCDMPMTRDKAETRCLPRPRSGRDLCAVGRGQNRGISYAGRPDRVLDLLVCAAARAGAGLRDANRSGCAVLLCGGGCARPRAV